MLQLSDWQNLLSLALGLGGFLSGGLMWYRGAVRKSYAAERDFAHLRRNQEQIQAALEQLQEEIEAIARDEAQSAERLRELERSIDEWGGNLREQKAFILAISNRLEGIAARMDGQVSGGWLRQPPPTSL